jgi:hypothetical protein
VHAMSEPVVPSSGGPGGLVAFVVTVEQGQHGNAALQGVEVAERVDGDPLAVDLAQQVHQLARLLAQLAQLRREAQPADVLARLLFGPASLTARSANCWRVSTLRIGSSSSATAAGSRPVWT